MPYKKPGERGITLPIVALFIVVLFGMAALAVDLGIVYTARTSAQHAADAAALAGAYTFMNPIAPQPASAQEAAIAIARQNKITGQAVVITAGNVVVDTVNRTVSVTVPRTGSNGIQTYFAAAIGWKAVNVNVKATAEAGNTGTAAHCLKPIFIPNTIISMLPPNVNPCNAGQMLFDGAGNLTPQAQAVLSSPNRLSYVIRPTSPQGAPVPSQYYSVDFGSGASTYRCALGQCLNGCGISNPKVFCGDTLVTENGNMVGPTKQGVADLIGNPSVYQWQGVGDYLNKDTSIVMDTAPNLMVVPVWDNCKSPLNPGKQPIKTVGFAQVFVDGVNGNGDITAHLVNAERCASGGGGGAGGQSSGPLGVPIRLIKTQ
jgi:hypothetical protein